VLFFPEYFVQVRFPKQGRLQDDRKQVPVHTRPPTKYLEELGFGLVSLHGALILDRRGQRFGLTEKEFILAGLLYAVFSLSGVADSILRRDQTPFHISELLDAL
jgi:hypothetical protein